jgi:hypothetical protein
MTKKNSAKESLSFTASALWEENYVSQHRMLQAAGARLLHHRTIAWRSATPKLAKSVTDWEVNLAYVVFSWDDLTIDS